MSRDLAVAMLIAVGTAQRGFAAIDDTVRDFLAHRPVRSRRGKVVAGVAAGLGRRYGVDPVLIRVALVVSAVFGGAGVLLYLLAWLGFAGEGDQVSPIEALLGRGRSDTSKALTIVLCVLLIPAGGFVFGGHLSTLVGAAMLLSALYLLHRGRADHVPPVVDAAPADAGPTDPAHPSPEPEARTMTDDTTTRGGPQDAPPPTPPSWDPLGAAPFAWDLPDPAPTPPQPPSPPRRRRIGLATVGAALVTGAVLAVLEPYVRWLTAPHIAGIVTGVLGVGLVAGAYARSGRGLVPLAIVACVATLALGARGFHGTSANPASNEVLYQPSSLSDVQSSYQRNFGDMTLDLTHLANVTGTVTTSASINTGQVTVLVPSTADVTVTCESSFGDVECLGQHESGAGNSPLHSSQNHYGTAKTTGLTIVLTDVSSNAGSVRVMSRG